MKALLVRAGTDQGRDGGTWNGSVNLPAGDFACAIGGDFQARRFLDLASPNNEL
jgi:hypothetical protein